MQELPARRSLSHRMESRLADLARQAQLRKLCPSQGINLSSNDYLGLAEDPRLKAGLLDAVESCTKTGSTGSRLMNGDDPAWNELEEEFAIFTGCEASLFFNSGYAANVGLLSVLLGQDDLVFSDALNHASIIDGIRLSRAKKVIYEHTDLNSLEHLLRQHRNHGHACVIVTESIFSMDGDRAPLPEIFQLASCYGAEVIIDEAHATGVCGPQGSGLAKESGLEPLAVIHTCGKALASMGAFVCGSKTLRRFLINHARSFIFSTALPRYCAEQVKVALRLAMNMEDERHHLGALAASLKNRLSELGHSCGPGTSHIIPLIVGGNAAAIHLADMLNRQGFSVYAVRPPSVPAGSARLRLSLTARLDLSDIEQFINILSSIAVTQHHA